MVLKQYILLLFSQELFWSTVVTRKVNECHIKSFLALRTFSLNNSESYDVGYGNNGSRLNEVNAIKVCKFSKESKICPLQTKQKIFLFGPGHGTSFKYWYVKHSSLVYS